ncbi:MAG: hypothetical protein KAR05_05225, partial [Candidatus Omnitrophica bacterium]|nr:hypothetical protein [Candidatus Omnitrophota bacterium]
MRKFRFLFYMVDWFVVFFFVFTVLMPTRGHAQGVTAGVGGGTVAGLPLPGVMVTRSPVFLPAILRGIKLYQDNPLRFDFIVDTGDTDLKGNGLEKETSKLIRYFLTSLTIPEDDLWVNLSPYESGRIIPDKFGITEMGRDLLAQDYILKQLTASLMYPEDALGEKFWEKVYAKANELYGTTELPINTFNKVWILPENAVVYENGDTAFIVESHLKVMLEQDYFALSKNSNKNNSRFDNNQLTAGNESVSFSDVSSSIIREVILPEIEKEVNEGEDFIQLRQIYHSLILAAWFKRNLKNSMLGKIYVGQNKITGINIADTKIKEKIYHQYMRAFKTGVYNYIREDYDPDTKNLISRKYFSGGARFTKEVTDAAMLVNSGKELRETAKKKIPPKRLQTAAIILDVTGRPKLEGIEVTDEEIAAIAERQVMVAGLIMRHSRVAEDDLLQIFGDLNDALASIFRDLRFDTKAEKLKMELFGIWRNFQINRDDPEKLMTRFFREIELLQEESRSAGVQQDKVGTRLKLFKDFEEMLLTEYEEFKQIEKEYLPKISSRFDEQIKGIHKNFKDAILYIAWMNRFFVGKTEDDEHMLKDILVYAIDIYFEEGVPDVIAEFEDIVIWGDIGLKCAFSMISSDLFYKEIRTWFEFSEKNDYFIVDIISPGSLMTSEEIEEFKELCERRAGELKIAREIFDMHGIKIEPSYDQEIKGSRFRIRIPKSRIGYKKKIGSQPAELTFHEKRILDELYPIARRWGNFLAFEAYFYDDVQEKWAEKDSERFRGLEKLVEGYWNKFPEFLEILKKPSLKGEFLNNEMAFVKLFLSTTAEQNREIKEQIDELVENVPEMGKDEVFKKFCRVHKFYFDRFRAKLRNDYNAGNIEKEAVDLNLVIEDLIKDHFKLRGIKENYDNNIGIISLDNKIFPTVIFNILKFINLPSFLQGPQEGEIQISTALEKRAERDNVKIEISYAGTDVLASVLGEEPERVFESYPTIIMEHGINARLDISAKIIKAHKGKITVEVVSTKEVKFTITLPADAAMAAETVSPEELVSSLNKKEKGGIDFNPERLDIQRRGEGINFDAYSGSGQDGQKGGGDFYGIQVDGFVPVIFSI